MIKKTDDKVIAIVEKEINPIVTKAKSLKVTTPESLKLSAELLSRANQALDKITEEKKKLTDPLNQAIKEVRFRYKVVEEPLQDIISYLRGEQSAYQTKVIAEQRKAEQKIAERVEQGKLTAEGAVRRLDKIEKSPDSVTTDSGMLKFRPDKVLKITDEKKIPRDFLIPDEKMILATLKAGKSVPGCEIEIVQVPLNYR